MKIRSRLVVPSLLCIAAALITTGCKNDAAERRGEIQDAIAKAGFALEQAAVIPVIVPLQPRDAADPEAQSAYSAASKSFNDRQSTLKSVFTRLGDFSDGEPDQQAAGALIATSARCELASMEIAQAAAVESQRRRDRSVLHSRIDAAMRLESMAEGRESVDTDDERALLASQRTRAQQMLREYSQQRSELDVPIAERQTQNARDAEEAASLDSRASTLRRTALEKGHSAGLDDFQEAIRLERQADSHEYRIAERENDLKYQLQPEHDLAVAKVGLLQAMLSDIATTENALDELDDLSTEDVSATRQVVAGFRDKIGEDLEAISDGPEGRLKIFYDQAGRELDLAVGQARTAVSKSSRDGKDAAKLAMVKAYELQGKLHANRAEGLTDQLSVLTRLIEAGGTLGSTDRFQNEYDAVSSEHTEAVEAATAALTSAKDQLGQVTGNSSVQAYKYGLDMRLAALAGEVMERPEISDAGRMAPQGGAADRSVDEVDRFDSPEELLAFLQSIQPGDVDGQERSLNHQHASSEVARKMIRHQRQALPPTRALMNALNDQFGEGGADAAMGSFGGVMGFGTATEALAEAVIKDRTDDRVTVAYTLPMVGEATMDLVRVDGRWLVDADTTFGTLDPAAVAQADAMMPIVHELFADFASRVRDGEFASAEEAGTALLTELVERIGGG